MTALTGMDVRPFEGDTVDDVKIVKVWFTGKIELANGRQLHCRDIMFVAGSNHTPSCYITNCRCWVCGNNVAIAQYDEDAGQCKECEQRNAMPLCMRPGFQWPTI